MMRKVLAAFSFLIFFAFYLSINSLAAIAADEWQCVGDLLTPPEGICSPVGKRVTQTQICGQGPPSDCTGRISCTHNRTLKYWPGRTETTTIVYECTEFTPGQLYAYWKRVSCKRRYGRRQICTNPPATIRCGRPPHDITIDPPKIDTEGPEAEDC